MEKRGLSQVVTTVIIIALGLVAIGIVWAVVQSIISGGLESVFFEKFTIRLEIKEAFVIGDNISIDIERDPGEGNLTGILFVFFDGSNSENIEHFVSLEELERRSFSFTLSELDVANVETVSISPIFRLESGEDSIGEVVDTYYIGSGGEPACIPECDGLECGNDGCGGSCGTCTGDDLCTAGICVPFDCTDNRTDMEVCGLSECGTQVDNCAVERNCGTCTGDDTCTEGLCVPPDCVDNRTDEEVCGNWTCGEQLDDCAEGRGCSPGCDPAEECEEGSCEFTQTSLNNGTIDSIWPPEVGMYFDSADLPITGISYTGYYAKFPGSLETECIQIMDYIFPVLPEESNKTHLRLIGATEISAMDNYEVWETYDGCTYVA